MPQFSHPIQKVPPGTQTMPGGAAAGAGVVFTRGTGVADGAFVRTAAGSGFEPQAPQKATSAATSTATILVLTMPK